MSTPCKHLQAAVRFIASSGLLRVSDRNDRVGISPDDQRRTIQPFQYVTQINALLSIPEGGIGGRDQRRLRAGLHALPVELLYERLLKQARVGEEACEFGAQVLMGRLGMHQADYCAIYLWPQSGAIDQDKSLDPLRIVSREGKSYCPSKRVADDAHTLPIRSQGIKEARQKTDQCWHAVIYGRFSAAACTDEIKRANAEPLGKGGQV